MEYLVQSAISLMVLTTCYGLFLQRITFYKWNRLLLMFIIGGALIIPVIPMPNDLVAAKEEWIAQIAVPELGTLNAPIAPIEKHPPAQIAPPNHLESNNPQEWTWASIHTIIWWIYMGGFLGLLLRLVIQLFGVFRHIQQAVVSKGKHYHLARLNSDISPYSFGKHIVLNPDLYNEKQFTQILNHEKWHVRLYHTIDLLLAEALIIFQWFNPFAWLHRHFMIQNLEFQVDDAMLTSGAEKKAYQYHLLQVAVPNFPLSITTNYNQSLIKKRIVMMNRRKSSMMTIMNYGLLLPIAFFLTVAFKTNAHPGAVIDQKKHDYDRVYVFVSDHATINELQQLQSDLSNIGYSLRFETLNFKNQTIKEADAILYDGSFMVGRCQFTAGTNGAFLFFRRAYDNNTNGSGFDATTIERMFDKHVDVRIFSAGIASDTAIKNKLLQHIQLIAHNQPNNSSATRQKHFSHVYDQVTPDVLQAIMQKVESPSANVQYYVDGVKWTGEAVSEKINPEQLEQVAVKEVQQVTLDASALETNIGPVQYYVFFTRKLNVATTAKSAKKNIYLVITEKVTRKDLENARNKLGEMGMQLTFTNLHFNDGLLTSIHLKVKDRSGFTGQVSHDFNEEPGGKVYVYRLTDPTVPNGFGVGYGRDFEHDEKFDQLPEQVKSALKGINHGYVVGRWSVN